MKLSVTDLDLSKLVISDEQAATRTPGVHVSSIIKKITKAIGSNKGDFSESDLSWFAVIGRLWERVLAEILFKPPRYERIGEIEKDGIIGSPDCIDMQEWEDIELKVTWQSSKNFSERPKFREYIWQGRSYCWMLSDVKPMRTTRFVVFHVCGDYRPPIPCAKEYVCEHTVQELKETWSMMLREKVNV